MICGESLIIEIPDREIEIFDPNTSEFTIVKTKGQKLKLRHSLISVKNWECKWKKPFLSKEDKTPEETRDYVRCMTITQNVDPDVYLGLTEENIREVMSYIEDSMTATTFRNTPGGRHSGQFITNELIYYWMVQAQIPFTAETWHLNRLFTLLKIHNNHNQPSKKMSKAERQALLAKRRSGRK